VSRFQPSCQNSDRKGLPSTALQTECDSYPSLEGPDAMTLLIERQLAAFAHHQYMAEL
jgi:hypothetical protein